MKILSTMKKGLLMALIVMMAIIPSLGLVEASDTNIESEFDSDRTYALFSAHSGNVLDVLSSSESNGANIHQWEYYGGDSQLWNLVHVEDDYYKIVSKKSGKVLEVQGNRSNEDRGNIRQWDYHGGDNQLWKIEKVNGGTYKIINEGSNKALEVADWNIDKGGNIQQYTYHGGDNQLWEIRGETVSLWSTIESNGKKSFSAENLLRNGETYDFQLGYLLKEEPSEPSKYYYRTVNGKEVIHGYVFNEGQPGTVPSNYIYNKEKDDHYLKTGDYLDPGEEKVENTGYIYPKTPFNSVKTQNNKRMVALKHRDEEKLTIIDIEDDGYVWYSRLDDKGWHQIKLNKKAERVAAYESQGTVFVFAQGTDHRLWLHVRFADEEANVGPVRWDQISDKWIDRLVMNQNESRITIRDENKKLWTAYARDKYPGDFSWEEVDLKEEIGKVKEIYGGAGRDLMMIAENHALWYYEGGPKLKRWKKVHDWVDRAAVASDHFQLDVIARDRDKNLLHFKQNKSVSWEGAKNLGGKYDLFDVGYGADKKLEVFARGEDFHLYQISEKDSAWGQWTKKGEYSDNFTVLDIEQAWDKKLGAALVGFDMNHDLVASVEIDDKQCMDWSLALPIDKEKVDEELSRGGVPLGGGLRPGPVQTILALFFIIQNVPTTPATPADLDIPLLYQCHNQPYFHGGQNPNPNNNGNFPNMQGIIALPNSILNFNGYTITSHALQTNYTFILHQYNGNNVQHQNAVNANPQALIGSNPITSQELQTALSAITNNSNPNHGLIWQNNGNWMYNGPNNLVIILDSTQRTVVTMYRR